MSSELSIVVKTPNSQVLEAKGIGTLHALEFKAMRGHPDDGLILNGGRE